LHPSHSRLPLTSSAREWEAGVAHGSRASPVRVYWTPRVPRFGSRASPVPGRLPAGRLSKCWRSRPGRAGYWVPVSTDQPVSPGSWLWVQEWTLLPDSEGCSSTDVHTLLGWTRPLPMARSKVCLASRGRREGRPSSLGRFCPRALRTVLTRIGPMSDPTNSGVLGPLLPRVGGGARRCEPAPKPSFRIGAHPPRSLMRPFSDAPVQLVAGRH
jgi:hypothetical protein